MLTKRTEKAQPDRWQKNQEQLVSQIPQGECYAETFLMKSSRMRRERYLLNFVASSRASSMEQWEGKLDWKG